MIKYGKIKALVLLQFRQPPLHIKDNSAAHSQKRPKSSFIGKIYHFKLVLIKLAPEELFTEHWNFIPIW